MLSNITSKLFLCAIAICLNIIALSQNNTTFDSLQFAERKSLIDALNQQEIAHINDSIPKDSLSLLHQDNVALQKIVEFDNTLIVSLSDFARQLLQTNKTIVASQLLGKEKTKATHKLYLIISVGVLLLFLFFIALLFVFTGRKKNKTIENLIAEKKAITEEQQEREKQIALIEKEKIDLSVNFDNQKLKIQSINQKAEALQSEITNIESKNNQELSKLNNDNLRIKTEYEEAIQRLTKTLREKSELEVVLGNKVNELSDYQNRVTLFDQTSKNIVNQNEELKKENEILKEENKLYKQNIEAETQVRTKIEGELQEFVNQLQAMLPLP